MDDSFRFAAAADAKRIKDHYTRKREVCTASDGKSKRISDFFRSKKEYDLKKICS